MSQPIQPSKPARHSITEWVLTFLTALWLSSSLAWPFVVPTGSMESSILVGDHIFVDKLSYSPSGPFSSRLLPYTDVRRGDIIVFRFPPNISENYVKRVIGVPGDRVRLRDRQLYLNGRAIDEPYKQHIDASPDNYRDNFPAAPATRSLYPQAERMLAEHVRDGELVVPPGHYFAMGDNRDNSVDSRYFGLVPRENINGKPWLVYWSFESSHPEGLQQAFNTDHLKDVVLGFFTRTRWKRTFMLVRGYPLE